MSRRCSMFLVDLPGLVHIDRTKYHLKEVRAINFVYNSLADLSYFKTLVI